MHDSLQIIGDWTNNEPIDTQRIESSAGFLGRIGMVVTNLVQHMQTHIRRPPKPPALRQEEYRDKLCESGSRAESKLTLVAIVGLATPVAGFWKV